MLGLWCKDDRPVRGAGQSRVATLAWDEDHPALALDCILCCAPLDERQARIGRCNRIDVDFGPQRATTFTAPAPLGQEVGDIADWGERLLVLGLRYICIDV